MELGDVIEKTLNSLQNRLDDSGILKQVQRSKGIVVDMEFTFNESATSDQIQAFEEENGWYVPKDY
ncbi:hypothetical protein C8P63_10979 [Melghirimyces profundicolus]|uniref:Uncharacterized protein n=1 Tax=Melghirimyces profundicolus TaxID=1242148 RepID=A0A2T6BW66_9BACL|nr:hypothetical protein [Melghirimyces profundicolus]PTX60315.1 hypothetical protein C8P63_10979 [Melghirimyces profundicolus]